MYRTILTGAIVGAALAVLPVAHAQQSSTPRTAGQQTTAGMQSKDKQIAQWLAADNYVEVEIAKLAKDKAKSDKVKDFAKTVCDDHEKAKEKLAKAVPGTSLDIDKDGSQDRGVARTQQSQQANTLTASRGRDDLDSSDLKRKIAKKRVECLKKELEDQDGDKFDAAFLGHQLVQHQNMIASLTVLENETDGDLKDAIKEERKTAEDHYEKAKELMKELKDDDD